MTIEAPRGDGGACVRAVAPVEGDGWDIHSTRCVGPRATLLDSQPPCCCHSSRCATAVATDAPCPTATIERVAKLSKDEVAALTRNLAVEWKAALTPAPRGSAEAQTPASAKDASGEELSAERLRKVRRMESEPLSLARLWRPSVMPSSWGSRVTAQGSASAGHRPPLLALGVVLSVDTLGDFGGPPWCRVPGRAPGSASAAGASGGARLTATIEHVTKLSKDEVAALTRSLAAEWKANLSTGDGASKLETPPPKSASDPAGDYWSEGRQRKVRRLAAGPLSSLAAPHAGN